jgi:sulfite reductase (NADPH) flavoprotein alpha-component
VYATLKRAPAPPAAPKPSVAAAAPAAEAVPEAGTAPQVTDAEIQQAAAPEVVPEAGASPAVPFHREDLMLTERMQLANERGGKFETKLFAAMAQTDCGACGWDCEGYANAIATGETDDISLCVPGESETLDMLKLLMEEAGKPFTGA